MARLKKTWTLPPPEETEEEYIWYPVVRVGRFIPFGYEQDPDDPDILLPIPEELELFEQAKIHLKQYSYRQVAAWLSEHLRAPRRTRRHCHVRAQGSSHSRRVRTLAMS